MSSIKIIRNSYLSAQRHDVCGRNSTYKSLCGPDQAYLKATFSLLRPSLGFSGTPTPERRFQPWRDVDASIFFLVASASHRCKCSGSEIFCHSTGRRSS